jgi:hypothetical protein
VKSGGVDGDVAVQWGRDPAAMVKTGDASRRLQHLLSIGLGKEVGQLQQ